MKKELTKKAPVKKETKVATADAKSAKPKVKREAKPKGVQPLSHGVGRRKAAVARVWLKKGSGAIIVNGRDMRDYFDTEINRLEAATPFRVIPVGQELDVEANVRGGGLSAQAGAVKLGIARALLIADESLRITLRANDLLTVDSRLKERKKYGQKAARRKFQFVKR